jgi:hypothetical protein
MSITRITLRLNIYSLTECFFLSYIKHIDSYTTLVKKPLKFQWQHWCFYWQHWCFYTYFICTKISLM